MLLKCWSFEPNERPDFGALKKFFQTLSEDPLHTEAVSPSMETTSFSSPQAIQADVLNAIKRKKTSKKKKKKQNVNDATSFGSNTLPFGRSTSKPSVSKGNQVSPAPEAFRLDVMPGLNPGLNPQRHVSLLDDADGALYLAVLHEVTRSVNYTS